MSHLSYWREVPCKLHFLKGLITIQLLFFFFLFPHTPKCGIIRYLAQKKPGKREERELCNLISPQPTLTPCADDCLGDVMMRKTLCHIRQEG